MTLEKAHIGYDDLCTPCRLSTLTDYAGHPGHYCHMRNAEGEACNCHLPGCHVPRNFIGSIIQDREWNLLDDEGDPYLLPWAEDRESAESYMHTVRTEGMRLAWRWSVRVYEKKGEFSYVEDATTPR